ncbi:MAG: class I SAM-dependent methyltransferase [Phycisphaeraceae bacterium]|nr:class I SAM-dependent methyltransferase [Phycisphaeraceae bacterium]
MGSLEELVRIRDGDRHAGRVGRSILAKALCQRTPRAWLERMGIHVVPVHFYQPLPDFAHLPESLWDDKDEPVGIELPTETMAELVHTIGQRFGNELAAFPSEADPDGPYQGYATHNGLFESVDAEMLYGLVRLRRPQRIIEIGSGYSTRLIRSAIARNRAEDPALDARLASVDPFAADDLSREAPHWARVYRHPVQAMDPSCVEALEPGDMLFIDSSHAVSVGSDVVFEFLELIPRVRPGVLIHVHDVFLPYEYPRAWVKERRIAWNEQYLLQSFLCHNRAYRIVFAGYWMHRKRPETLEAHVPTYDRRTTAPGSFYFERVA